MSPKYSSAKASQEEYEEWLGRIEEEEPLSEDRELFQETLRSELYGLNDEQIEALWGVKQLQTDYSEHGIRALIVRYPWGSEIRYGIQGVSGLWGWESVQAFREEEEW
jgi:hypothetical protein